MNIPRTRIVKRPTLLVGLAIGALVLATAPTRRGEAAGRRAGATVWTHVASACAADPASAGAYSTSNAAFRHLGAATGTIYGRCNVVNPEDFGPPGWNYLEVTYKDPVGFGSNQVRRGTLPRLQCERGLEPGGGVQ